MEEAAARAAAELDARRKRIAELKAEQDRRLNDPAERAKLFVNANKLIEDGIKEYEAKGYKVNVVFDENNLFEKLVFKFGKSRKSGTRGPRKKAGDVGYVSPMTRDQFVGIYPNLGSTFTKKDIVNALIKKFGNGKDTDFNPQPGLGNILDNGYEGIKIEKVGTKGPGVYYKKIS